MAINLFTSRKSSSADNTLLRSAERRVVINRAGSALLSARTVCQEISDLLLPDLGIALTHKIGGRALGENGDVAETAKYLGEAIRIISGGRAKKIFTPWNEFTRFNWSNTFSWVVGGGVVEGKFGEQLIPETAKVLGENYRVELATNRRWAGTVGTAEFLPVSAFSGRRESINFISLDLGGSSLKLSIMRVSGTTGKALSDQPFSHLKVIDRPADIRNVWEIPLEETKKDAVKTCDWIARSAAKLILEANRTKLKLSSHIVMAVPFEVNELGERVSGGIYPIPSVADGGFSLRQTIGGRVSKYLNDALYSHLTPDSANIQEYQLSIDNDAIIAAAGSLPDRRIEKMGYIGLGSGVGGALFSADFI
jgi:hypothetical protein